MLLSQQGSRVADPPNLAAPSTQLVPLHPILIDYDQLIGLGITYSREHLRRLEAAAMFPRRVRLSPSRVAWMYSEVMAWIIDRADQRRAA